MTFASNTMEHSQCNHRIAEEKRHLAFFHLHITLLQPIGIVSFRRIVQPRSNCSYGIIIASPPFFPVPFSMVPALFTTGATLAPAPSQNAQIPVYGVRSCLTPARNTLLRPPDHLGFSHGADKVFLWHASFSEFDIEYFKMNLRVQQVCYFGATAFRR
jgi:hypothetical protein